MGGRTFNCIHRETEDVKLYVGWPGAREWRLARDGWWAGENTVGRGTGWRRRKAGWGTFCLCTMFPF
jgi:hypothetical protein